jgi:hypothetical protein
MNNALNVGTWILTFNRPVALNRLITELGRQGIRSNIMSNHSVVSLTDESKPFVDQVVINSLNSDESNGWNARSWNSAFIKALPISNGIMCIQDDTFVHPEFALWFNSWRQHYDFIWGPAGDQFYYLTLGVLQKSGYWDERFCSPYCGDADFLKRVYFSGYDRGRMSIEDTHDWGFTMNPIGIQQAIRTELQSKSIDPNYENVHWHMERMQPEQGRDRNKTLLRAQAFYAKKWGHVLNGNGPEVATNTPAFPEIDWYPWATTKYKITAYDGIQ